MAVKKKKWHDIIASKEFKNQIIGETFIFDANNLIGRNIEINLINLADNVKNQNVKIIFKVNKVEDGRALTDITKYVLSQAYVKRIMRKSVNIVDDSSVYDVKNGKVKVKVLMLTRYKTNKSVLKTLKSKFKENFIEMIKDKEFSDILNDAISGKLKNDLKSKLNKIYPLVVFEFKAIEKI